MFLRAFGGFVDFCFLFGQLCCVCFFAFVCLLLEFGMIYALLLRLLHVFCILVGSSYFPRNYDEATEMQRCKTSNKMQHMR